MGTEGLLDRARAVLRPHMRELSRRRRWRYWTDLSGTSALAWSSLLAGAALAGGAGASLPLAARVPLAGLLFCVAVLSLYRASALLHEVAHVRQTMPAYAVAWDILIGVPLLLPSIVYEGVHTTHHDRGAFGTDRDPEYLRLDGTGHATHALMLVRFALVPVVLAIRWAVLAPLSVLHADLRRFVVERFSSLAGNALYRRPIPRGAAGRRFTALEAACWVWSTTMLLLVLGGAIPLATVAFVALIAICVSVLHGTRSFATHRFRGEGQPRTIDEQFLDSVNVTGHPLLTELWAPCGLRYHALHHLVPRLPYHALGEAHRMLLQALPPDDAYCAVTFDGLMEVVAHVAAAAGDGPRAANVGRVAT